MIVLQPKRWQSSEDPMFDPIRGKPWFWRLEKRKKVIPLMQQCYAQWFSPDCVLTQEELCDKWNVSPREFRDYILFVLGKSREITPTDQSILDSAYKAYCLSNADKPIQKFIQGIAPLYGVKYRPVWELWETSPTFYPTGYIQ